MIGMVKGTTRQMKQVAGLPAPIASFRTNMSGNINSLKVLVTAQQDLHGYDKPWAGGGGKNKCKMSSNPIVLSSAGNIGNQTCAIPAGTYTYSWTSSATTAISLSLWNGETQIGSFNSQGSTQGRSSLTFTISQSATHLRCYYNGATSVSNIQVESGSSMTDYAPYENICPITGWSGANVTWCGVNVWDEEYVVSSSMIMTKNYVPCKPSTTYYRVSPNNIIILYYDKDKKSLGNSTWGRGNFTTPANCCFLRFQVDPAYGTTYNNDISINYPSTDTAYHAYNGNTYTIAFGGTYYGGVLDVTNGVLRVTWKAIKFSDISWTYDSPYSRMQSETISDIKGASTVLVRQMNFMCSCYQVISDGRPLANVPDKSIYWGGIDNRRFYVRDSNYTDATTWVVQFQNAQLCYELATPIEIQLTPQQIVQLLGDNNVFADCGDVEEVKYLNRIDTVLFSKG